MSRRLKSKLLAWILRRSQSCGKATWLIAQSLYRKLSFREQVALSIHMRLCSHCVHFREQIEMLRRILLARDDVESADADLSVSLSPKARERIKKALRDRLEAGTGESERAPDQ